MTFQRFQDLLPRAAARYGISKEYQAIKVCQTFRGILPDIFKGKKEAQNCIRPGSYKENKLTIDVDSPGWAQEVIMRKEKIIAEMNAKMGRQVIKDLKTRLRK